MSLHTPMLASTSKSPKFEKPAERKGQHCIRETRQLRVRAPLPHQATGRGRSPRSELGGGGDLA